MLIPASQTTPTPTTTAIATNTPTVIPTIVPTPVLTPITTTTPTPTAVGTPATISFVGTGPLSDSASAVTSVFVTLPSGVQSGDVLLTQIVVYDGTGSDVPTAPPGWTAIRHDSANRTNLLTSWLYYKIAGPNEPPSYGWSIVSNYAAGAMGAWRGAATSPIDNTSGASATGTGSISAAAPLLTPSNDSEVQVYFYGSQSHAGPTISMSNALNQRFDTSSSKEGFTIALGDLAAPAGGNSSLTYTAGASISSGTLVMTAQAVLLVPASGQGSSKQH
jgi:hypothetical protein